MGKKRIFITGCAGFIGYHLAKKLLSEDCKVIGIDNLNNYYDVNLKKDRLKKLDEFHNFEFIEGDIAYENVINDIFKKFKFDIVVNLAAQAGVRYSIENPRSYINSNIVGFFNILEACRYNPVKHLVFASSSSVYGNQEKTPFAVTDNVDRPISLYAATKKSDELMAFTYAHLYKIPVTGLRFFTVYGPWGRPDMAYFSFTNKIYADEPIKIFNNGDMLRDFTYIDDIVHGIELLINKAPKGEDPYKIYNIGNNKPIKLLYFIETLEKCIGKTAKKEYLPMQPGDVYQTFADISDIENDFGFKPETSIEEGLKNFADWYKHYYQK
ncbi:MAG: NAD-dependent epimerase [Phascolarctobacterium sp.]|nr:MAG: NAD-dependent epimerase [Phascolarctobacterium sp.]